MNKDNDAYYIYKDISETKIKEHETGFKFILNQFIGFSRIKKAVKIV